jgi:hypothetical protein
MHSKRSLLVVAAAILSLAAFAPAVAASPRSGDLHVTKECSQYTGAAGEFCTITSSNLKAIPPGTKVIYLKALTYPILDTDIVLDPPGPGHNKAFGHVYLDLSTGVGVATFRGGTGKFTWFHASVAVAPNAAEPSGWSWEGTYWFGPHHGRGHDHGHR